jgi:hypothetical protein
MSGTSLHIAVRKAFHENILIAGCGTGSDSHTPSVRLHARCKCDVAIGIRLGDWRRIG